MAYPLINPPKGILPCNLWTLKPTSPSKKSLATKSTKKLGMEEKFLKGKIEGKIEVARNMLAVGIAPEIIMQTTGMSQAEVLGLMHKD